MIKLTNREKSRKPRTGKTYCYSCDSSGVGIGEICKVCGFRSQTNRAAARDSGIFDEQD